MICDNIISSLDTAQRIHLKSLFQMKRKRKILQDSIQYLPQTLGKNRELGYHLSRGKSFLDSRNFLPLLLTFILHEPGLFWKMPVGTKSMYLPVTVYHALSLFAVGLHNQTLSGKTSYIWQNTQKIGFTNFKYQK